MKTPSVTTSICVAGPGSGDSEETFHPNIPAGSSKPSRGTGQGLAVPPPHAPEQPLTEYKPIINCYEKRIAPCARRALVFSLNHNKILLAYGLLRDHF